MSKLAFLPLPGPLAEQFRAGAPDANGQPAERHLAQGGGNPCRCCLGYIPEGAPMLILAYRPFGALHPYAETGPIFLCADSCTPWAGEGMPPILDGSPDYLLKGYSADERIVYGTGKVVPKGEIEAYAGALLERKGIAFVDIRSARNNCFQLRISRG